MVGLIVYYSKVSCCDSSDKHPPTQRLNTNILIFLSLSLLSICYQFSGMSSMCNLACISVFRWIILKV